MKIELIEVAGFYPAAMSARAAMKSYDRCDTKPGSLEFGQNDKDLISRLVKAGSPHDKCIRQIYAWLSIDAPRFWWAEMDTYRIGVEKGSESTMHTIMKRPLEFTDFDEENIRADQLAILNEMIALYNANGKNPETFLTIKRMLPEGFLQKRFVSASYRALRTIYWQRSNHKLPHWKEFCQFLLTRLPESWIISVE